MLLLKISEIKVMNFWDRGKELRKEADAYRAAVRSVTEHLADDKAKALPATAFEEWSPSGVIYSVGKIVLYGGVTYRVIQGHTSQAAWTPVAYTAGFSAFSTENVGGATYEVWKQPTGAHDAYGKGKRVLFEGKVYESLIDGNTWSPTAYPGGWKLIV